MPRTTNRNDNNVTEETRKALTSRGNGVVSSLQVVTITIRMNLTRDEKFSFPFLLFSHKKLHTLTLFFLITHCILLARELNLAF